ncbi:MAG: outer membrane beta-barrel family protein, partial [Bacteroidota bacterium]
HSREKIRLYGSNDYNRDRTFNRWFADVDYNVPVFCGQIESGFLSRTEPTTESHNANFGFDAYLTSRTTLGASVRYNNSDVASAVRNTADYLLTQSDSLINVGVVLDGNNVWDNVTSNVYLEQKIGKGSIQLDYDYLYFKNENTSQVQTSFSDDESNEIIPDDEQFSTRQRSLSNTPISINVVKLDYSVDLNDEVKLETGVKGTLTASDSESGIQALVNGEWVNVGSTTTDLDMDETVAAFYTSFNVKVSPTVNINAGVRYEYSDTEVAAVKPENEVDRELSELFPSLFLSKKINDDMDLNFSYSRRISRPTYNDLASTVTYSDPTSVYSGNPLLRPTITNTVKMDYRVKDYSFSLSASRDDNPIARFQITRAGDIDLLVVGPVNVDYQNNLTFQTNIPYKITDWWTTNQGFVGGWRQFRLAHTAENVEHTYFGFNLYGSQTFSLPKGYSLELSGWFNSASFNGSVRVESFGALNLGLKKDLPNNMGSFQFSVSDLLKSINITSGFGSLTREAFDVSSSLDFMAESARARIVKFTYSKSFGGNKVRGKKWRGSGSQDEENRVLRN